ncbi:MAG: hypothetical protein DHS20C15_34350 [Planctomycetota bacterium]|nr:MAG: hypothetical protein DHS20C15_34350 [Planctomycetota bacterium]
MSRPRVPPRPSSSIEESPLGAACHAFRDWLAGLALREPVRSGDGEVAAHARACRSCDAFADDLAASSHWLLQHGGAGEDRVAEGRGSESPDPAELDRALSVQLRARLARDLLTRSRGEVGRERDVIDDDLCRLDLLTRRAGIACPDVERVRHALQPGRVARARLLALATRLDPMGLDIALAWIGWLLHMGRRDRADQYADRLASELPGSGR